MLEIKTLIIQPQQPLMLSFPLRTKRAGIEPGLFRVSVGLSISMILFMILTRLSGKY
jgi:hypothetical protein